MPQARGTDSVFALYEESTYATNPGVPAGQKLYLTANNIQAAQPRIPSNTLLGNRERSEGLLDNINVSGTLDCEIGAEWMGTLLKHTLGNNATTGADPYTHTMDLQADLPTGLIIETDYGSAISGSGRVKYFNGCKIGGVTFNFPTAGPLTASFSLVGAKETSATSALDASLDDNGHTSFGGFDIGTIEEGGGAIATVQSATITLDNGLDESLYVIGGAGQRRALPEGFATVTGTVVALFEDATLLTKAENSTESSLKIIASRGDGLGSAGNESMEWFVQQLKYARNSVPVPGPEGLLVSLNFESYLNSDGTTSALQMITKNAVATV